MLNAAQHQRRADIIFTAHWGGPTRIEYITNTHDGVLIPTGIKECPIPFTILESKAYLTAISVCRSCVLIFSVFLRFLLVRLATGLQAISTLYLLPEDQFLGVCHI